MGRVQAGLTRDALIRNVLGSLAILGVVVAIGVGLPAVNNAIPAARAVPAGRAYLVGGGVTVLPPAGAQYDVTKSVTSPDGSQGAVLFVLGNVRFTVTVLKFTGSLSTASAALRTAITRGRGYQLLGREGPTRTVAGVAGVQGGYTTATGTGRYAVFVHDGLAAEVTFAGSDIDRPESLATLTASVASIVFGPVR